MRATQNSAKDAGTGFRLAAQQQLQAEAEGQRSASALPRPGLAGGPTPCGESTGMDGCLSTPDAERLGAPGLLPCQRLCSYVGHPVSPSVSAVLPGLSVCAYVCVCACV
jgi:hypothetical protein